MGGARRIRVEGSELTAYRAVLRQRIHADLDRVEDHMPIGPLTVRVRVRGAPIQADFPLIGYAPHGRGFSLWPNLATDLTAVLDGHLLPTLAHESHHVLRWRHGEGHGRTVLGFVVAEGLANHFSALVTGNAIEHDATEEVRLLAVRAPENGDTAVGMAEYRQWFLGDEDAGLPPGAGYRLGNAVVGHHLAQCGGHPGDLHAADSRSFRAALEAVARG